MYRITSKFGGASGPSGGYLLEGFPLPSGYVSDLAGVLKALQKAAERLAGTGSGWAAATRTAYPGMSTRLPFGTVMPPAPSKADLNYIQPLAGGSLLEGLADLERGYEQMRSRIGSGNTEIMTGFLRLFGQLKSGGTEAFGALGQRFESLKDTLFGGLGDYALQLGAVSGYASKAFAAFRTLNPFAAAFAAAGLSALGQVLRGLTSGSAGKSPAVSASFSLGADTATAGAAKVNNDTWRGPQVVNVYIDGLRNSSPQEIDRTLGRAGVDRELRQRIRELARSGANPLRVS